MESFKFQGYYTKQIKIALFENPSKDFDFDCDNFQVFNTRYCGEVDFLDIFESSCCCKCCKKFATFYLQDPSIVEKNGRNILIAKANALTL